MHQFGANFPPSDDVISSEDLWNVLTSKTRPHRLVPFPRKGVKAHVAIVVLNNDEESSAKVSAIAWVKKKLRESQAMPIGQEASIGFEELLNERLCVETLFRAVRTPEDLEKQFFKTHQHVGYLTTSEIANLQWAYMTIRAELGPTDRELGPEELDAWVKKLAEGGSMAPFVLLSSEQRSQLVLHMAARCSSSASDKSSPGSPPGSST